MEKLAIFFEKSILRRILLLVMACFMIVAIVISAFSIVTANHEVEEVFDARLSQQARMLRSFVLGSLDHDFNMIKKGVFLDVVENAFSRKDSTAPHEYEHKVYFEIKVDGETWLGSNHKLNEKLASSKQGFSYMENNKHRWRTYHLINRVEQHNISILVAEREDIRAEMVEYIVIQSVIPQLISLPILTYLLLLAIKKGISPLENLANEISKRNFKCLEAVEIRSLPLELFPIQNKLNDLLHDIDCMMAREQRFISDAAHELRTPLAVLKIHAQNAQQVPDKLDQLKALKALEQGVDRASRMVAQLLTLARLEQGQVKNNKDKIESLDLLKALRTSLAGMIPLALSKNIEITLEADQSKKWRFALSSGLFDILIQNLVSNSIKHSPAYSCIEVFLTQTHEYFRLSVIDHGTGLNVENESFQEVKVRLVERFYHEGENAGSGLGLSIVHNIMTKLEGRLDFHPTLGGGLTVSLLMPKT